MLDKNLRAGMDQGKPEGIFNISGTPRASCPFLPPAATAAVSSILLKSFSLGPDGAARAA